MYFLEDIYIKCPECHGRRYNQKALCVHYKGRSIADILDMTVDSTLELFREEKTIYSRLRPLWEIGLGYLKLGQPYNTLSGGEAQRLYICSQLNGADKKGMLYILDEPTIGLHNHDIGLLMAIIGRLTAAGNTVIIIEHNLEVIKASDYIIDLGPGAGEKGGRLIYQGGTGEFLENLESLTAQCLRDNILSDDLL